MKKVQINIKIDKKNHLINFDWPISFICGREMIELFGVREPLNTGLVIYLFHNSEFGDGKWIPNFKPKKSEGDRIAVFVYLIRLHSKNLLLQFMKI